MLARELMIAKCHHSQSFRQLARYLERPKADRANVQRVAWKEARNLNAGTDAQAAAREMRALASRNTRTKKPVLHMSLSWAPSDQPTRDQMREVTDRVLHTLEVQHHQTLLIAHSDEGYAHLHAMTNRISPATTRTRPQSFYYAKIQAVLRHAEREMGFRETPGHLYQLPGQSPPDRRESLSKSAHKATERSGEVPFQVLVREVAESDFDTATSWTDLHRRLDVHGLQVRRNDRGLVVTDGSEFCKSSSVARNVSLRKLEERFGAPFESHARVSDLQRGIRALQDVALSASCTQSGRRAAVRDFVRLDAECTNLKARLGKAAFQVLADWHREHRHHEISL